ncbi:MAG: NAD(P)-binding protein [Pseudomonadales bacterium]
MDDKRLGMNRAISRRDFVNGAKSVAMGAAISGCASPAVQQRSAAIHDYPPAKTGLRGSHTGSYEVAHELARAGRRDWGPVQKNNEDPYDLIVVGAGISGLAAAHFYRQRDPFARILILDNHDDFGGHAKRNEFYYKNKSYLSYGGSQSLEDPGSYSAVAKGLLADIGVDTKRFETAYDQDFFQRHDLGGSVYFDKEAYGSDKLVAYPMQTYDNFLPLAEPHMSLEQAVAQMPLSAEAQQQLSRLMGINENLLTDIAAEDQKEYLRNISYKDFLVRHIGIDSPEVFSFLQGLTNDSLSSIETATALGLIGYVGLPGLNATALAGADEESEPYIFHFPDGNASIARLLVRRMIPAVAQGNSMEDIVAAPFDYSQLDRADSSTRIRLNSTAVKVEHDNERHVRVQFVRDGRAYQVSAKQCVLATYNAIIPHLCPELDEGQAKALEWSVKSPIIYTSVLLSNWRAWKNLSIAQISAPSSYYSVSFLDFPISMGGYRFSHSPDDPIVVHMERFALGANTLASPREQRIAGRHELFATPFENIERETRKQLAGALGEGGFDPASDIVGITVNRWAHGYARSRNPMYDDMSAAVPAHEAGRQTLGNIAIANSDAAASATMDAAIDQAHRAVEDLFAT